MFEDFEHSAFRMATLQTYNIPREQERLRSFLQGIENPDDDPEVSAWHEEIRKTLAAGKTMHRLKVVRRQFTDYPRYLLARGIHGNVAAGEDYRILDVTGRETPVP